MFCASHEQPRKSSGFLLFGQDFSRQRVFLALSVEVIKTTCWHNEIKEAIYWIINQICSTFRPQVRKDHCRKSPMLGLKCTRCLQVLQNRDIKIEWPLRNVFWWFVGRSRALRLDRYSSLIIPSEKADRFNSYKHMARVFCGRFFEAFAIFFDLKLKVLERPFILLCCANEHQRTPTSNLV